MRLMDKAPFSRGWSARRYNSQGTYFQEESNGIARKRLLGTLQSQPLGVHLHDPGDPDCRYFSGNDCFVGSEGEGRAEVVGCNAADDTVSPATFQSVFTDLETA